MCTLKLIRYQINPRILGVLKQDHLKLTESNVSIVEYHTTIFEKEEKESLQTEINSYFEHHYGAILLDDIEIANNMHLLLKLINKEL